MARMQTEIYRPFEGEIRRRSLPCLPIVSSGIRVAARKKLPLLLFFGPPAIAGIIGSFVIYATLAAKALGQRSGNPVQALEAGIMSRMVQVQHEILQMNHVLQFFTLLVIAWFGAGLIAEDRRAGAHLLYFSRPISRLDYYLGHLGVVLFFGLCAVLIPGVLICLVATFASEDYEFLTEQWNVILATFGFGFVFVGSLSTLVLAISSLVPRKSIALAVIFGLLLSNHALGNVLRRLQGGEDDWMAVSILANFQRLASWMFDVRPQFEFNPWWSVMILSGLTLISFAIAFGRIRKLEAVG